LTYFATAGLLMLLIGGILLMLLIDSYNASRVFNIPHTVITVVLLTLGQTLLITGVTTYVASRRGYTPPQIPQLPSAESVALIPAYNEERNIGTVVREAKKYVDLVIVVDDGSKDKTAEEAAKAGAVVIKHPTNMGYGAAVKTLLYVFLSSGAKYAVQLDADGQHDPSDIPKFLQALREGADMAVGNRFVKSRVPLYRKLGIYIIRFTLRLLGVKVADPENGYRAYTRKAVEILHPQLDEIWMGISSQAIYLAAKSRLKVGEVPTKVTYGPDTSSEMPIIHGISIIWTIIWTWLTHHPVRTIIIALIILSISIFLYSYIIFLFNLTRYIRLTYTMSAILLIIISTILLSIGITSTLLRKKY